ncbi:F0F1 ATP synthase subunit A [Dehalococcoidia bacterium]|nr:F0F1 ATP synthase subunit A [Dehalococcoidia bacterium]
MTRNRILLFALIAIGLTVLGRLFLNAPIAHIQFAAETVGNDIFGRWDITNSIIAAWVAMGTLALIAFLGTRKMKMIPGRFQGLVEGSVGWLLGLAEDIAGKVNGRRFFPIVATLFFFIIIANWTALVPVFGTIGKVESAEEVLHHKLESVVKDLNGALPEAQHYKDHYDHGHPPPAEVIAALRSEAGDERLVIFEGETGFRFIPMGFGKAKEIRMHEYWDFEHWQARTGTVSSGEKTVHLEGKTVGRLLPFLRSMNTDLMNPLAMAIIAMFMVQYWGIKANGFFGYMSRFINFKGGPIGFVVGILEGISEIARLISFSFRLLGNMFAGEVLLFAFLFLLPIMAGVFIMPFILEVFVGFIQAVIFAALTLIFASLAVESHEGEGSTSH